MNWLSFKAYESALLLQSFFFFYPGDFQNSSLL